MPCYPSLSTGLKLQPNYFPRWQNRVTNNKSYLGYIPISYNARPQISVTPKRSEILPSSIGLASLSASSVSLLPSPSPISSHISISSSTFSHSYFFFVRLPAQHESGVVFRPNHPCIYSWELLPCLGLFWVSCVLFWIGLFRVTILGRRSEMGYSSRKNTALGSFVAWGLYWSLSSCQGAHLQKHESLCVNPLLIFIWRERAGAFGPTAHMSAAPFPGMMLPNLQTLPVLPS